MEVTGVARATVSGAPWVPLSPADFTQYPVMTWPAGAVTVSESALPGTGWWSGQFPTGVASAAVAPATRLAARMPATAVAESTMRGVMGRP